MEATVSTNADEVGDHASPQTTRPSGQGFPPLMLLGFFERDLDFYLTTMDKGIAASRFDPPASLQLTNIFDVGDYAHRHFYIFSAMCLPALSKSASKLANGQAAARLAATAFAIEAYRQIHNSLPSALNDLTADFLASVPKDPFDGQPIRYRRATRGYLLHSVDADGHDDNGVEPPPRRKPKDPATYDFSFTVGR
jgi:hypothetical protein